MTILTNSKKDVLNNRLDMVDAPLVLANLTTTERDAIPAIINGMVVLNTTTGKVQARIASAWVDLN